jgi:adenine-specific DNA-methyltransferase
MSPPRKAAQREVARLRHQDKRANIPTDELRSFQPDEPGQREPARYARDPSLDPQLVWKGKDDEDSADLAVDDVPVYIQEKIQPQAIIERLHSLSSQDEQLDLDLFSDFNGIEFNDLVDFYRHEQSWTNRLILGDSLLVMTSLAEREGLKDKVQMIYLDPPYGIEFGSNWQTSTRKNKVQDGKVEDATRQPEQIRAFRDTWRLGIHSYLSYLRDRLTVARDLLTPTGSIFVQIGDENVHLVRSVMDEVFGSECHVVSIAVKKKGSQKSNLLDPVNDYLLWYTKTSRHGPDANSIKFRPLLVGRELDGETLSEFNRVELPDGTVHSVARMPGPDGEEIDYRDRPEQLLRDHPNARLFRPWPITNGGERANQMDPIVIDGKSYSPPRGRCWSHTSRSQNGELPGMERVKLAGRLIASGKSVDFKRYLDDFAYKSVSNWWDRLGGASKPIYVVQTNVEIIRRCILMTTDPGDLVLDPTCGSGSTPYVAEQWGRRWIAIDTSRVALALTRSRLMGAMYPYYLLADSEDGQRRQAELTGRESGAVTGTRDVRRGFIYQRAQHITSASIANNPEIDEATPANQVETIIRDGAESRPLVDRPLTDSSRVRVTGPFTVESLSPHRVMPAGDADEPAEAGPSDEAGFVISILENLRKAGVQNAVKGERLAFDALESISGSYWLQARGSFTDPDGQSRSVAVSIGPQYGTVDSEHIRESAKESLRGAGYDLLLVCAFAFDPHAGETASEFKPASSDGWAVAAEERRLGRLPVLLVRMNADLTMGDDLLKKTGAGNLFTVFGEPDVDIRRTDEGQLEVELRGVDVYDPTTGELRSRSVEDIACWFIDTDYDRESFFVRDAYFSGGRDWYEQLAKTLRAEVDREAWESLYRNVSRPFPVPSTGHIAVKVINHYGDEVMKTYGIPS